MRIYPVGRLDKDSEGLLLMTNDGAIVNGIMRARNRHEKEYQVEVNKEITPEFLKEMASGVPILDTVTRSCRIQKTGERSFTIILTQGLNRQIRRMCEALGYRVTKLKRVRIMNIHLKDLKTGEYRPLTEKELAELKSRSGRKSDERDRTDEGTGQKLNEAAKAYYQEDREIMSNLEYDTLYDELQVLEEKQA